MTQTKADGRYLQKSGGTLSGRLNMSNNLIISLGSPTGDAGATNVGWVKTYVANQTGNLLPKAGGTMSGILDMGHSRVTNLPKATDNEDTTSVAWVKENTLTPTQVEVKINQLI